MLNKTAYIIVNINRSLEEAFRFLNGNIHYNTVEEAQKDIERFDIPSSTILKVTYQTTEENGKFTRSTTVEKLP